MKHLAAYLLLVLGGKDATAEAIKDLLSKASIETDDEDIERLLKAVEGKVRRRAWRAARCAAPRAGGWGGGGRRPSAGR